jgi:hypothetical protein
VGLFVRPTEPFEGSFGRDRPTPGPSLQERGGVFPAYCVIATAGALTPTIGPIGTSSSSRPSSGA